MISFDFYEICKTIPKWTWSEINYGLENGFINTSDVVDYSKSIIDNNIEHFELITNLVLSENDNVKDILSELVRKETDQIESIILDKWIFTIIYFAYREYPEKVFDVIEDLFETYPTKKALLPMIAYMPSLGKSSMKESLENYLDDGVKKWIGEK